MLFNQTVQLIELTKELERIPVDTLKFSYALGHTYKDAGNWISGVFTNEIKAYPALTYLRETGFDKWYKSIAQGTINIRGMTAHFDDPNSTDSLPVELPVTVTVSINGTQIYQRVIPAEDYDAEGKIIDTVDISAYVGTVEIKYYANIKRYNRDIYAQRVYTTQAIQDIPNEKPRSITDVINRVLDVGVGCRTLSEKPFYKLDPVYAEMFSKIPAPEYTFTRATLYEVLLEIGTTNNLGATPSIRLHYSQTCRGLLPV